MDIPDRRSASGRIPSRSHMWSPLQSETQVIVSLPEEQTPWAIWTLTGWVTLDPLTETEYQEFPVVVCSKVLMHPESVIPERVMEKVL